MASDLVRGRLSDRSRTMNRLTCMAFVTFGALAAQFAPGTSARLAFYEAQGGTGDVNFGTLAGLDRAFTDWWHGLANPGTVTVLLLGSGLAVLWGFLGHRFDGRRLVGAALLLLVFSLVLAVTSWVGDLFAYDAPWHQVQVRLAIWLSAGTGGIALGSWASGKERDSLLAPAALLGLLCALLLSLAAIVTMGQAIAAREKVWRSGAAPLPEISDLDDGWRDEWTTLSEARGWPTRRG